jgi:outer membrane murein-binding lipoprotein Lpp
MPERTLTARVENLERKMESLEGLPGRVSAAELQIVHFRGEMHEQFSAVRQEIQAVRSELGGEIQTLRAEIQAGDEETRRYMRVLHEEVLSRIAAIQEGRVRRRRR